MRYFVLSILAELLLAVLASGAEPPFVVENKTAPKFTVTNKAGCPCPFGCECYKGQRCECTLICPCGADCPGLKIPVGAVRTLEGNLIAPDGKGGWRYVETPKTVKAAPAVQRGYWRQVCDGKTCRLVWVPIN